MMLQTGRKMCGWRASLAACLLGLSPASPAAVLVDDATLVGAVSKPVAKEFEIPAAGLYELQLVDVGIPTVLQQLRAAVTRGDERVTALDAAGKIQFDATAGRHVLQVAGTAISVAGVGSFSVRIVAVSTGTIVLDYADAVSTPRPPLPTGQATLQTQVTLAPAGIHRIMLSDKSFPEPLAAIDLLLSRGGVQVARLNAATPSAEFDGTLGAYDLLVVARAGAATDAGLYSVQVVNLTTGALAYDVGHPVGLLDTGEPVVLPDAPSLTLSTADLRFPGALASAAAVLMRGGTVLASRVGAGTTTFNAPAGVAQVYALSEPTPPSQVGAMSVEILNDMTLVASRVFVASPAASTSEASLLLGEFVATNAGSHRVTVTDFDFPGALAELNFGVFQGGKELARRAVAGTLDVQIGTGLAVVLVAARPVAATGSGLFGVQVVPESGTTVFETTQAVGAGFQRRVVRVPADGSYDVTLTDLLFPSRFGALDAALTRGTQRVGFVYGGGKFSFNAAAGEYSMNVITRVDPSAQFGMFGLAVETTPPAPTLTLAAEPLDVRSGDSTTLTWSSTGASNCAASGQWSGVKATSGNELVGPVTVAGVYSLSCTGPGGTTSQSVSVSVRAAGRNGGGGAFSALPLLGLLGLLRRKRRVPANT